jgi:hypothetical protein
VEPRNVVQSLIEDLVYECGKWGRENEISSLSNRDLCADYRGQEGSDMNCNTHLAWVEGNQMRLEGPV